MNKKLPKWAVAVALVLLAAAAVYAAGRIGAHFYGERTAEDARKKNEAMESPAVESGYGSTVVVEKPNPVMLVSEGLDYEKRDFDDFYNYEKKDDDQGRSFRCRLLQVDKEMDKQLFFPEGAAESSMEDVGGHEAMYLQWNQIIGSSYNRRNGIWHQLFVFFEKEGYILNFEAYNSLSREELLECASYFSLRACEEAEADKPLLLSRALVKLEPEFWVDVAENQIVVTEDQIADDGEAVAFQGLEYTLKKTEVFDSIKRGAEWSEWFDGDEWKPYLTKGGKWKAYDREVLERESGAVKELCQVVDREKARPCVVVLTMKAKNVSDLPKDIGNMEMGYYEKGQGGYHDLAGLYFRPEVLEGYFSPIKISGAASLKPGKECVYRIAFLTDRDLVDEAYLLFGYEMDSANQFDGQLIAVAKGRQ